MIRTFAAKLRRAQTILNCGDERDPRGMGKGAESVIGSRFARAGWRLWPPYGCCALSAKVFIIASAASRGASEKC